VGLTPSDRYLWMQHENVEEIDKATCIWQADISQISN